MRRAKATWPALVMAIGLTLVGAACAGSDDESSSRDVAPVGEALGEEGSGDDADEAADAGAGATTVEGAPGEDLGAQAPPEADTERIVYTADVRVRVEDPTAAANEAIALVEDAGGSLAGMSESEGEDTVTVTVRVPVDGFRPALDALGALGTVLDRHVEAEEVTDQIVDLEGRLENARASADRLRELYATAEGVDQIVSIEQALTQREAEVESLAGQLQQLEDRADRSTITATYVDEGEPVVDDEPPPDDDNAFVDGLQAGRDVLVGLGTVLAAIAGFALPFLPFVLVPAVLALVVVRIRRRRSRRAAQPADADAVDDATDAAAPPPDDSDD